MSAKPAIKGRLVLTDSSEQMHRRSSPELSSSEREKRTKSARQDSLSPTAPPVSLMG